MYAEETTRARVPVAAQHHRDQQHRPGDHAVRNRGAEATHCSPACCAPTTSGARACPNPKPGSDLASLRTQALSETATTSSSTARRSGPRSATAPTGASSMCGPIPKRPSTRASRASSSTCHPAASKRDRCVTLNGDSRLRRGVLQRRPGSRRRAARPTEQGLAGRDHHAELRTRGSRTALRRDAGAAARSRRRPRLRATADRRSTIPSTLRRLGELDVRIKNLEVLCQRSRSRRACTAVTGSPPRAWPNRSGARSARTWPRWRSTLWTPARPAAGGTDFG